MRVGGNQLRSQSLGGGVQQGVGNSQVMLDANRRTGEGNIFIYRRQEMSQRRRYKLVGNRLWLAKQQELAYLEQDDGRHDDGSLTLNIRGEEVRFRVRGYVFEPARGID